MNSDALTPKRQRLLLAAVMSGLLLAMLDQTIVGTALPAIVRHLDGSNLYVWVVTASLVTATVLLPALPRARPSMCGAAARPLGPLRSRPPSTPACRTATAAARCC